MSYLNIGPKRRVSGYEGSQRPLGQEITEKIMSKNLNAVPSQRQQQRITTRNRLFDLCVAEFRRVGVETTRISDVALRAGVVAGTFYFHFPSKNHVLLELGNRYIAQVVEQLPGSSADPTDLATLLNALVEATLSVEEQFADRALFRAVVSSFQHPSVDIPVESIRLQVALRDCIAEAGSMAGEAALSADELSTLILTAFFGALLVGPDDPRERAAQLHRTLHFFARALEMKEG